MNDSKDEQRAQPLAYEQIDGVQIEVCGDGRTLEIHLPAPREPLRPAMLAGIYAGAGAAVATSALSYCALQLGIDPFTGSAAAAWAVAALGVGYFGFQAHQTVKATAQGYERPTVILLTDERLVVFTPSGTWCRFRRDAIDDVYLFLGNSLRIHEKQRDSGAFINLAGLSPDDRRRVRDALRKALRLR